MEDSQDQAEQLFATLVGLDPSAREAYLEEIGRTSPSLRLRVEQLLRDDKLAGSFMNRPLLDPAQTPTVTHLSASGDEPHGPVNVYLPQFHPGDVIADRYVVARFIAKGGMGEVYEVEDKHLRGVHVALKTILSHFATDPMMHERFKREVLTAREISHPNVCAVYDLLEWDRGEGRLLFLTMKLLPGETLLTRLAREGRRPQAELAAITRQVGSGLAAAHAAGVLHRDIKSANIMLNGTGASVFAWITDFGLARSMVQEGTALTVHGIPGTPGYVAPELFYGDPPSRASDVFAFGVVLYEMITGKLPRGSITDPQCKKELQTGEMTGPWRRMVEGCLQPAPELRCQDIESALKMVPGLAASSTHTVPWTGGRTLTTFSRRHVLGITGAAAAVAAGSGAWLEWRRILDVIDPLPARRAVALMAWPNGDDDAVVSTVLDSISQRLARAEAYVRDFVIITVQDLPQSMRSLSSPTNSENTLGANLVLTAALQQSASSPRLNLQLLAAQSQRVLRKASIAFTREQIGSLSEKASEEAAALLQLPRREVAMNDPEELRHVSPEVFQVFSEAEHAMKEPNHIGLQEAIVKYQRALELDSHFSLGYAKLAIAYIERNIVNRNTADLDLADKNASSAQRYNPHSAMGLSARALVHLYEGRTNQSLEYFGKALQADPGNPDILLRKAHALENKEELREAEKVYQSILSERPNYWPAYNDLGEVLAREARYQEAAKAFAAAGAAAPNVSLPMANLGATYIQLGNPQAARSALTEALRRGPETDSYLALGDLEFSDGRYDAARRDYEEAAKLKPNYHLIFRNIGDCYAMTGNAQKVKENYEKAARLLSASLTTNAQNGYNWATLAFYHAKLGNTPVAQSDIRESEKRKTEDVESRFLVTQALALMGRKQEALKLLLWCMDKGLSPDEVNLALDLKDLRKDPSYLARLKRRSANSVLSN